MNLALAIDGDNFVHVQWHGSQGKADCAAALRSLVDDYTRRYRARVAICFDPPELTWRHSLYADYKGTRGPKEPGLLHQLAMAKQYADEADLLYPPIEGYEADDLLAVFTTDWIARGGRMVIMSRDKDCRQLLVDGQVSLLVNHSRYRGDYSYTYETASNLLQATGLTPQQWPDYRALTGDPSDNWPGAKGIGEKAAKAILSKAGSLPAAMQNLWSLPITDRQRDTLTTFPWQMALDLMTLRRHAPAEVGA